MGNSPRRVLALVAAASMSVALAACGGGGDDEPAGGSGGDGDSATGGTLTYYIRAAIDHTDPQRTYSGRDITNWSRTVYRSLVTFPISEDVDEATTPVPDLATDTGTSEEGGKVWKFTVKDGVTWEDGKPITCEDFRYGASRVFATDVITGGPNYLLTYLDVPLDEKSGLPAYEGPYTKVGQDLYDKAVTCEGNTITYRFKKPWADFPLAVASLHMMDPYRADKDQGEKSNYAIFSSGPYRLDGIWDKNKGGTLVRNGNYEPSTDSPDIRQALPDTIVFDIGKTSEQITDQLIADSGADKYAVAEARIPASYYSQITGDIAERSVTVTSPYTDYLALNFKRLTNLQVRQALAASTDDTAWVSAGGGDKAFKEATDIVNPAVKGYQEGLFPGGSGDPEKSKQLLEQAGVQTPYPITFTYPSTPTADKQASALKEAWEAGGFKVTLKGVVNQDAYYTNIQNPGQDADVIWAGWGADWPSAITVTAPLFDSRPNLTKNSNGQDYGAYKSDEFEALVDQAQAASDLDEQTRILQDADKVLAKDVAYVPIDTAVFYFLHGSGVKNYINTAASNGYPDLGPIGVK